MKTSKKTLLLLLLLLLAPLLWGKPKQKIYLRGIEVDLEKKQLAVSGRINMQKGLIELLATAPGGKDHESILVLEANPALLQTGLILLGAKKGGGGAYQGSDAPVRGDKIYIYVKWQEKDQEKILRAEQMIFDRKNRQVMSPVGWIFTGSRFVKNQKTGQEIFAANVTGVLVATFYDPDSILNNPLPERADDTVYYAHPENIPKRGTAVTVIFSLQPLSLDNEGKKSQAASEKPNEQNTK